MTFVRKPPYGRLRVQGGFVRPSISSAAVRVTFGQTAGTMVTTDEGSRLGAYEGEHKMMSDIVTPGFMEIVKSGGIINNGLTSVTCVASQGGTGQTVQYTGPTNPWPVNVTNTLTVKSTLRTYDARFLLPSVINAEGMVFDPLASSIDLGRLYQRAYTSAMSKVDQSTAQGLVSLGELGATLKMLISPMSSIRSFLTKWRRRVNKTSWQRKAMSNEGIVLAGGLGAAVANDYLQLYYGLKPFCRDIESLLEAYVKQGSQPERQTARGGADDSYTTSHTDIGTGSPTGGSYYSVKLDHSEIATVRSGILYEPSEDTYRKAFGMRFEDLFSAAYQLVPWSFFLDYFSNLGKLIEALTPRQGVRYLANWRTVTLVTTDRAECVGGGYGASTMQWTSGNTEWAERVIKTRVRTPLQTYTDLGLVLSSGTWDDKSKVMAVLSLAIQQLPLQKLWKMSNYK